MDFSRRVKKLGLKKWKKQADPVSNEYLKQDVKDNANICCRETETVLHNSSGVLIPKFQIRNVFPPDMLVWPTLSSPKMSASENFKWQEIVSPVIKMKRSILQPRIPPAHRNEGPDILRMKYEELAANFIEALHSNVFGGISTADVPQHSINEDLETWLESSLIKDFTPVRVNQDSNSFYSSISVLMFADPFCHDVLREVLHYHFLQNFFLAFKLNRFNDESGEFFSKSIIENSDPKPTGIMLTSHMLRRRINLVCFNEFGKMETANYYDVTSEVKLNSNEITLGFYNETYFPLLPRNSKQPPASRHLKPVITRAQLAKLEELKITDKIVFETPVESTKVRRLGSTCLTNTAKNFIKTDCSSSVETEVEQARPAFNKFKAHVLQNFVEEYFVSDYEQLQIDNEVMNTMPRALKGWTAIRSARDGNCFYEAVSNSIAKNGKLSRTFRGSAYAEFKVSEAHYSHLLKNFTESEIRGNLLTMGVYATEFSMYLLSGVIKRPIVVCTKRRETMKNDPLGYSAKYYHAYEETTCVHHPVVLYLHGEHFSALIRKDKSIPVPPLQYTPAEFRKKSLKKENLQQYVQSQYCNVTVDVVELSGDDTAPAVIEEKIVTENPTNLENNFGAKSSLQPGYLKANKKVEICSQQDLVNVVLPLQLAAKKSKGFSTANDTLFRAVATSIVNNINFQQDQLNFIKKSTESTELWYQHTKEQIKNRKLNASQIRNICHRMAQIRNHSKNRKLFQSILELQGYQNLALYYKQIVSISAKTPELNCEVEEKNTGTGEQNAGTPGINKEILEVPQDTISNKHNNGVNCEGGNVDDSKQPFTQSTNKPPSTATLPNQETQKLTDEEPLETKVGRDVICDILGITPEDLSYQPPIKFSLTLTAEEMREAFDFDAAHPQFKHYKWANVISKALSNSQGVCSFSARYPPYYYARSANPFSRMVGNCSGDCGMRFELFLKDQPKKGNESTFSVVSHGIFHLLQTKSTARQIRGNDRARLAEELEKKKSKVVFLQNLNHLSGLRFLHNNQTQQSENVLRKIRSETKSNKREHQDPEKELIHLRNKFRDEIQNTKYVHGYIQRINATAGNLFVTMYDELSLKLHGDQLRRGTVVIHIDATGGVCRKVTERSILLYVIHAVTESKIAYPIGECLMERATNEDIRHFISTLRQDLVKIKPNLRHQFADICVCDYSYAMIHAICKGVNDELLENYIDQCWKLFRFGKWDVSPADKKRSAIFICTAHLIKAVQRNLSKKLGSGSKTKSIKEMAMYSFARLQEVSEFTEFQSISKVVIQTFSFKEMLPKTLVENEEILKSKLHQAETDSENEEGNGLHETVTDIFDEEDIIVKNSALLRESSKFYHLFKSIRSQEQQTYNEIEKDNWIKNPYYNTNVLDIIEKEKIALWPLWSSMVPKKLGNEKFIRETNAPVEAEFGARKNIYHSDKNVLYTDYIRESKTYHQAKTKEALTKLLFNPKAPKASKSKFPNDLKPETWKPKKRKESKYFSRKGSQRAKKDLNKPSLNEENLSHHKDKKDPATNLTDNSVPPPLKKPRTKAQEKATNSDLRDTSDPITKLGTKSQDNFSSEALDPSEKLFVPLDGCALTRREIATMVSGDEWLSNDTIDPYLSHIAKKFDVDNVTVNSSHLIFCERDTWMGIGKTFSECQDYKFKPLRFILQPVNVNNHWILLLFDTIKKVCKVFDSLMPKEKVILLQNASQIQMFVLPVIKKLADLSDDIWTVEYEERVPRQHDTKSCGVALMQIAKYLILAPNDYYIPPTNYNEARIKILKEMLSTTAKGSEILEHAKNVTGALDIKRLLKLVAPKELQTQGAQRMHTNLTHKFNSAK